MAGIHNQILSVILLKSSYHWLEKKEASLHLSSLMRRGPTPSIFPKKFFQKAYTTDLPQPGTILTVDEGFRTCKTVFLKLLLKDCNWFRISLWNAKPIITWCFHGNIQFNILIYLLKIWKVHDHIIKKTKVTDNFRSHTNVTTVSICRNIYSVFFLYLETHLKIYTFRKLDYTVHTTCVFCFLLIYFEQLSKSVNMSLRIFRWSF